ncbi:MAG: ankyrin repeat domain-containing protein [Candidatus Babeliales bacterium]|nr:ankyrin repeat domain-containing protein [Candidatus Babeliales bacterium]
MKKIFNFLVLILSLQVYSLFANPMHEAAARGDVQSLKLLTQDEIDMFKDEFDANGDCPIHCAAKNLQISVIAFLLHNDVLINSLNKNGETILHIFADDVKKDNSEAIYFALNRGAFINAQDGIYNSTAMHRAISANNSAHVNAFLNFRTSNPQNHLNLTVQNKFGQTALMLAHAFHSQGYDRSAIISIIDSVLASGHVAMPMQFNPSMFPASAEMPYTPMYYPAPMPYQTIQNYGQDLANKAPKRNRRKIKAPVVAQEQVALDLSEKKEQEQVQPENAQLVEQLVATPAVEDAQPNMIVDQSEIKVELSQEEYPPLSALKSKESPIIKKKSKVGNAKKKAVKPEPEVVVPIVMSQVELEEVANAQVHAVQVSKSNPVLTQKVSSNSDEEFAKEAIEKVDKVKSGLSKHKLEKQKKLAAKAKILLAKSKKSKQAPKLKAVSSSVSLSGSESSFEDFENNDSGPEDFELVEAYDATDESKKQILQVKKDLRLHDAISKLKSFEEIEPLVTMQAINTPDNDVNFPVHLASIFKNIEVCKKIVQVLVENIADKDELKEKINVANGAGRTALYYAIEKKDMEIVDYLLSKDADRDLLPEKTNNKLIVMEHARELKALQDASEESQSAFVAASSVAASSSSKHEDLSNEQVKLLKNNIQDSQTTEEESFNNYFIAFIMSIIAGKYKEVKAWVDNFPVLATMRDGNEMSALHVAVINNSHKNSFKIIKLLADRNPKAILLDIDSTELHPLNYAISLGDVEVCKYFCFKLRSVPIMNYAVIFEELIVFANQEMEQSKNAKKNNKIKDIIRLLQDALKFFKVMHKNNTLAHALINGTQVGKYNYIDKSKLNSLLVGHVKQYVKSKLPVVREEIKEIISAGANLKEINDNGWYCLHIFAALGDADIVELLLKHGADPAAQDNLGNTPLHVALEHENKEVVAKLSYPGEHLLVKNNEFLTPMLLSEVKAPEYFDLLTKHADVSHKQLLQDIHDVRAHDVDNKYAKLDDLKQFVLNVLANSSEEFDTHQVVFHEAESEDDQKEHSQALIEQ